MDDWDDDPVAVVPEPEEAPKNDPKLEKVVQMIEDVNNFFLANDIHRFFRRHVARHIHRHLGYNGWSKKTQGEFDVRFKGLMSDPTFIQTMCRKIVNMEMGHALGVKYCASFIVTTAGFTAFALTETD
jgi:hypothetical protein